MVGHLETHLGHLAAYLGHLETQLKNLKEYLGHVRVAGG